MVKLKFQSSQATLSYRVAVATDANVPRRQRVRCRACDTVFPEVRRDGGENAKNIYRTADERIIAKNFSGCAPLVRLRLGCE